MNVFHTLLQDTPGSPLPNDTIDSPSESLRKLPKTIEGVEVGRLAVASEGVTVQLDPLEGITGRLGQVVVIPAEEKEVGLG